METGLRRILYRIFENELVRRVIKNSSYLFSATGISAALSMLQGILVARMLGVAGFGILGAIITFTSVINRFASFRMSELVIKYVGHYNEARDQERSAAVFKAAALTEMLASLFAFGLIAVLAPLGARFLAKDTSTTNWFVIYGLIVLANLVSESSTGFLQICDRFRRMAALNLLQSIVTLTMITIAFFTGGGMLEVLLAYLCGKTVSALGLTISAFVEAQRRWGSAWWRTPLKLLQPQGRELAHFAISTNISASLSLINKDSELLWISFLRSPVEAGYYKLALTLINLVQLPVSPLPQATYPELSREVARKNWKNVRFVMRQGSLLSGGYTLAAGLALMLLGQPLISLLYHPEFLPAYPALMILLLGFLVSNTFYWARTALLALGQPDFPTKVNLVLAGLKIAGILLLVPRFGYLANASLLSASYFLGITALVWKTGVIMKQKETEALAL